MDCQHILQAVSYTHLDVYKRQVLKVVDLSVVNEDGTIGLNNINFKLKSGEILGLSLIHI